MKYLLTIILTITILTAQEGQVTNVVAQQRTDGSHIVDITYDLLPDSQFPSFTVFAYISIDGGETFESFNINNSLFPNVLGDNVLPGTGKSFYWDHVEDYQSISSDNIIFKISAYGHEAITLPVSFEMIDIPAGDYMGFYYNVTSGGSVDHFDGHDSIKTIPYNYEIMKYPVTNAQFCTFLLELLDQNLITGPSGSNTVLYDYSESVNPYPVPNPPIPEEYHHSAIAYVPTSPSHEYSRIYWNGETYLVEEGYADHPVIRVYTYGMELFAEYYGLRLPTMAEFKKAFRGMEDYEYMNGYQQEDYLSDEGLNEMNQHINFRYSYDTWEELGGSGRNTTPVNYYDGRLYGDFQTEDTKSEYGLYDMLGNVGEIVTVDAGCHYAYHSCGYDEDGNLMVNSYGLPSSKPYYAHKLFFDTNGGYASLESGQNGIHGWYYLSRGHSDWDLGFRCARTINSNDE